CQDAIQAVYVTARGPTCKRVWALDADLAAAFDQIDHTHLLDQLGTFPAKGWIADWLGAGVMDQGRFAPTERGGPQGGVISPVLMNVALHGMEQTAGVRYITTGTHAGTAMPNSPVVIRYADDLLAFCHTVEQAQQVKARLAQWLASRGLTFNELDYHMWKLAYKWAKYRHPRKSKRWITARYVGAFNSSRRDRWVFGDRDTGAYLVKFVWTKIFRHTLVKGAASLDDPTLTD